MPQLTIGTQRLIQRAIIDSFEYEHENNKHGLSNEVILADIAREVAELAKNFAEQLESDLEEEDDE